MAEKRWDANTNLELMTKEAGDDELSDVGTVRTPDSHPHRSLGKGDKMAALEERELKGGFDLGSLGGRGKGERERDRDQ